MNTLPDSSVNLFGEVDDSVTVVALADLIGVDRRTITELAQRNIAVPQGRGYALAESVRRYCAHLRELATGRGGEAAIASATAERARLAHEQANHIALKNATLRGSLLDAGAVEREWSDLLRMVRAGVLAAPGRCAARLPHLGSHDIAEIDSELRTVLTELGTDKGNEPA